MQVLRRLWRESLIFRRAIAVLSLVLATLAVSMGSRVPLTDTLPDKELQAKSVVQANQELRIYSPRVDVGGPVLSFEGAANVGTEVWVDHAALTGSSKLFAALAPPGLARAVYAADSQQAKATGKDCRTSLTISRAENTGAPQLLRLWQAGNIRGDQGFRQVTISSPDTDLNVEVSTNSPPARQSLCPRALTMGDKAIDVEGGPVYLLVPKNEPITLLFSAIDPSKPLWPKAEDTFDGLSLGDGNLRVGGTDVAYTNAQGNPPLHVVAHKAADVFTVHDLKLGAEQAAFSMGVGLEPADVWVEGKKTPVFNLVEWIKGNLMLDSIMGVVLIPGLWAWIKTSCFPESIKKGRVSRGVRRARG